MPITFIDIEKRKSWRIFVIFLALIALYFITALAITVSFYQVFSVGLFRFRSILHSPSHILLVLLFSLTLASIHFLLSAFNAVTHIRNNLGAVAPDREDDVHKMLLNIADELHIASGRRSRIEYLIIPTLSMNALSAVDLRGNSIIAITEGLLSRLSRPQAEAVVAHEAYHILSGDCLETTVATSLFGIPSSAIEKIGNASEGRFFLSPAFLLAWSLVKLSHLLNMFISREREYRADAGAVRMTRNPLALAEVLYMLARNWKGAGFIGTGLETLCITHPSNGQLSESEGFAADLFSTHPPIMKRVDILLRMAHASISGLKKQDAGNAPERQANAPEWSFYALDNRYQWQGPYSFSELVLLPWMTALTWIGNGEGAVEKAGQIAAIRDAFKERLGCGEQQASGLTCPSCGNPLVSKPYERTTIYQCRFCGGALVENAKIPRIIARKDVKYSERIRTLSQATLNENQLRRIARYAGKGNRANTHLSLCPKCGHEMNRTFYSMAYLIELDRCSYCRLTWFDNDELEMLQCMIDNRMASAALPLSDDLPPDCGSRVNSW